MDVARAEAILQRIQDRPESAPRIAKLDGDKVFITPLANNAFQITSEDYANPRGLKSYKYLQKIGADMRVRPNTTCYPMSHYSVIVTWDSAVHFLMVNDMLKLTEG